MRKFKTWKEVYDQASGRTYWYDTADTTQVRWDPPEELIEAALAWVNNAVPQQISPLPTSPPGGFDATCAATDITHDLANGIHGDLAGDITGDELTWPSSDQVTQAAKRQKTDEDPDAATKDAMAKEAALATAKGSSTNLSQFTLDALATMERPPPTADIVGALQARLAQTDEMAYEARLLRELIAERELMFEAASQAAAKVKADFVADKEARRLRRKACDFWKPVPDGAVCQCPDEPPQQVPWHPPAPEACVGMQCVVRDTLGGLYSTHEELATRLGAIAQGWKPDMPVCVGDMAVVVGRGLFFPGGKDGRGHKDNKMAVCVRVANGSVALFDERAIQYLADGEDPVVYNNCDRVIAYIPDVPKETDVDFDARSREWPPTKLIVSFARAQPRNRAATCSHPARPRLAPVHTCLGTRRVSGCAEGRARVFLRLRRLRTLPSVLAWTVNLITNVCRWCRPAPFSPALAPLFRLCLCLSAPPPSSLPLCHPHAVPVPCPTTIVPPQDPLTGLPWQCYGIVSDLPEGPYGARCLVRYTDMPARADFQSPDEPFGFVSSNPETMLPMDYIRHEGCL